ncbi:hypothetical protein [Jatrophihabitans fulvus]
MIVGILVLAACVYALYVAALCALDDRRPGTPSRDTSRRTRTPERRVVSGAMSGADYRRLMERTAAHDQRRRPLVPPRA